MPDNNAIEKNEKGMILNKKNEAFLFSLRTYGTRKQ